ncbi:MAG TPA: hypothetical protein VIS76_16535 [Pseudomonadales bacterium]
MRRDMFLKDDEALKRLLSMLAIGDEPDEDDDDDDDDEGKGGPPNKNQ